VEKRISMKSYKRETSNTEADPEASSSAPGERPVVVDPTLSKCPPKITTCSVLKLNLIKKNYI
jgi:hypothetical protein